MFQAVDTWKNKLFGNICMLRLRIGIAGRQYHCTSAVRFLTFKGLCFVHVICIYSTMNNAVEFV